MSAFVAGIVELLNAVAAATASVSADAATLSLIPHFAS
ncbi:hypothetical protein PSP20601_04923 [Pandoraea sputorum]|nr:hypothetical protein PSP20601_04923 [Pandoraea sputorum]